VQSQVAVTVVEDEPDVTQVTGALTLVPGDPGDVRNSQVALYSTLADWVAYAPFMFVASTGSTASSGTYTIGTQSQPVPPGAWFIDAWRDNDNSGAWNSGDLVGWFGSGGLGGGPSLTQFPIVTGQRKATNMEMQTIP